MIMHVRFHRKSGGPIAIDFYTFMLISLLCFSIPLTALAQWEDYIFEITGDGVTHPVTLTMAELENMEQYQHIYSAVNTYPTKKWYTAEGISLRTLLDLAGFKAEEAQLLRFVSKDGYEVTLTVKELLGDTRYYFPGLKENHPHDGSIPGSPADKSEVEPIIALYSVEDSNDPEHMNNKDALHLIFGQRAVTEQTASLFLKRISKVEVLTDTLEKWDNPKTNIVNDAVVPKGTLLELFNKQGDADKIYYTTDGSTPTVESPMFNWISRRWYSLRPEDLDIVNNPLELKEDTVIKAITIGPGKANSDVVTFTFTVDDTDQAVDPTKISGGLPTGISLDRDKLGLEVGSAFRLEATITPYNADNKQVVWSSSDTRVATVDRNGLVTVVGPGTAIITASTLDGIHTSTCIINDSNNNESNESRGQDGAGIPSDETSKDDTWENPLKSETNQRTPEEKDEKTLKNAVSVFEDNEIQRNSSVPIDQTRYLAKKEELIPSNAADMTLELQKDESKHIFEMTLSNSAFPIKEQRDNLHIHIAIIFFTLFLFGLIKRYLQCIKEQKLK